MKEMSQHDKVIRLCEGGQVEVNGHWVQLMRCDIDEDDCFLCDMDCICHEEMAYICAECAVLIKTGCYLTLANSLKK